MVHFQRLLRKNRHYRKALRILKRTYYGKLARTRSGRYQKRDWTQIANDPRDVCFMCRNGCHNFCERRSCKCCGLPRLEMRA